MHLPIYFFKWKVKSHEPKTGLMYPFAHCAWVLGADTVSKHYAVKTEPSMVPPMDLHVLIGYLTLVHAQWSPYVFNTTVVISAHKMITAPGAPHSQLV